MRCIELQVGGLTPLTTLDYPGELAAVVFCQGCAWRCRYCHNPELLPLQSQNPIPWQQVLAFLKQRQGLLDAVVFSGGEPTRQAALGSALAQARALGFKTGLHSAGAYPARLERLLPLLDWVGLDIKAPPEHYAALTGRASSGAAAWESARCLIASRKPHEIRITLYPSLLPVPVVQQLLAQLAQLGAPQVVLQAYRHLRGINPDLPPAIPWDPSPYQALQAQYPNLGLRL